MACFTNVKQTQCVQYVWSVGKLMGMCRCRGIECICVYLVCSNVSDLWLWHRKGKSFEMVCVYMWFQCDVCYCRSGLLSSCAYMCCSWSVWATGRPVNHLITQSTAAHPIRASIKTRTCRAARLIKIKHHKKFGSIITCIWECKIFQNNETKALLPVVLCQNIMLDGLMFKKEEMKLSINYINLILQLYCSLSGVLVNYYSFVCLFVLRVKYCNSNCNSLVLFEK